LRANCGRGLLCRLHLLSFHRTSPTRWGSGPQSGPDPGRSRGVQPACPAAVREERARSRQNDRARESCTPYNPPRFAVSGPPHLASESPKTERYYRLRSHARRAPRFRDHPLPGPREACAGASTTSEHPRGGAEPRDRCRRSPTDDTAGRHPAGSGAKMRGRP